MGVGGAVAAPGETTTWRGSGPENVSWLGFVGGEACRRSAPDAWPSLGARVAGVSGGAAKLVRACGGCLGTRRRKGVEDCDKSGGVVKRALIPEHPSQPGELKHLSTRRKRKKPRFRQ